jgi:uncharacterized protein (TIGR00266 family)
MEIDIQYRPTHAMARVRLGPGESMLAESGAMVAMSPNVNVQTGAGGLHKGLKRLFGGETFFRNTFTAQGGAAEVYFAPALSGDMEALEVSPSRNYFLQSTAFVACSPDVDVETKVGGFKTFFAGEGIFVLKTTGRGTVLVGSYGAIERIDVRGEYIVDSGHLVAWDEGLQYSVTKAADGWIASFLSGEGLVCHFRGQGTVWIQTRNPAAYGQELGRLLPPRRE